MITGNWYCCCLLSLISRSVRFNSQKQSVSIHVHWTCNGLVARMRTLRREERNKNKNHTNKHKPMKKKPSFIVFLRNVRLAERIVRGDGTERTNKERSDTESESVRLDFNAWQIWPITFIGLFSRIIQSPNQAIRSAHTERIAALCDQMRRVWCSPRQFIDELRLYCDCSN